ncbi:MMS19 nucleotide excision repair protein-like protein [Quillaja saponaria]|uniref:MMS19 nucleotide excision repair protein n=1 Tax=Quillaja saponaria TaxID=32244 RepID=A0AAD7LS22_QUISA|nr:MMS19 nucleotide excision repair protein-like protein [Quillaja saponaria]
MADWKALRGALVGCLALLKRTSSAGVVTGSDAKVAAQSYLQNLQVQSLGQHDRKLCFELLDCMLERYPKAVAELGDDLIYGICEAIDAEKDPECLMLTFHIIESLVQLFPDPSGPLASFAGDIFEILGCYFPIHFTHPKGENVDVQRDDLSRALMSAFSSTPLFEPFVIPLLLEKMSSSLQSSKVDSLKYLSNCSSKYGGDRMTKHARAIWSSLKDAILSSLQEPVFLSSSELTDGLDFQDNEIVTEALSLLEQLIMQNNDLLLSLIVGDEDVNMIFNSTTSYEEYNDISLQGKQKLHAIGRLLYITAKTSIASCNIVFGSLFSRLMDLLGFSMRNTSGDSLLIDDYVPSERLHFGGLYLAIEMLSGFRNLIAGSENLILQSLSEHEICCGMLCSFSTSLVKAFGSILATSSNNGPLDSDIYIGVAGLQIMATFPGDDFPVTKYIFENILVTFMSIITSEFNKLTLWKLALKALVRIGSFIDRFHQSERASSYCHIIVDNLVSVVSLDDSIMPLLVKLEALSAIGTSGMNYMMKIARGLEEAIFSNLSDVYVHGNLKSVEIVVQLLECYSCKVLPWIHEKGGAEEVVMQFAFNIWSQIENCLDFSVHVLEKGLLNATMKAIKFAVSSCSVENQNIIIQKAYSVLASNTSFQLNESMFISSSIELEGLQLSPKAYNLSQRDEWILSLFASVVIAVYPQTHIPNIRAILHLFLTTLLKGVVPAAKALGSMINKLVQKSNGAEVSNDCTLEEALNMIFDTKIWFDDNGILKRCGGLGNSSGVGLTDLCLGVANNRLLQVHAISGLAWIGKGLLLQGHQKLRDVTMIFLDCITSGRIRGALPLMQHFNGFFSTMVPILQSLIVRSDSSFSRSLLYRAFVHIMSETPLVVILGDAKKLIPILLDCLSMLTEDIPDRDLLYGLLLVLSGILTDKNGQEAVTENAHIIINCLMTLIVYPHNTLVRETAIQCLVAMSELPHVRIYPMRTQVLRAISKGLDDSRRAVRQEAVRCRQAWASIASRSLRC